MWKVKLHSNVVLTQSEWLNHTERRSGRVLWWVSSLLSRFELSVTEQLLISQYRQSIPNEYLTNWLKPSMLSLIPVCNPKKWHCLLSDVWLNCLFDQKTLCDPYHVIRYQLNCLVLRFSLKQIKGPRLFPPGGAEATQWTCSDGGKSCRCPQVKYISSSNSSVKQRHSLQTT